MQVVPRQSKGWPLISPGSLVRLSPTESRKVKEVSISYCGGGGGRRGGRDGERERAVR